MDIGSSKVCCIIAKISRDKRINVVGYGYNASKGIKNGIITDLNQATLSICNAVETAEQMANERIDRVIVNISGDRIKSSLKGATIAINRNRPVNDLDIKKVIEKGINKINVEDNELIHCLPTNYRLDLGEEIKDPRNIYGENLSVNILLGMVPDIQFKNLSTVIENAHLEIAEKAFSAYASGLACLVDDEKEIGASGKMNFKPIFDQMYANNIKDWYVEVEQYTQNDPVASVQQSYDYLNKADYVK